MECDGNFDLSGCDVPGRCYICYLAVAGYDAVNDLMAFVEGCFGESPVFDDSDVMREGSDGFDCLGGRCSDKGYKPVHFVFDPRACKVFGKLFPDLVDQVAERALPSILFDCFFERNTFLFCQKFQVSAAFSWNYSGGQLFNWIDFDQGGGSD